MTKKRSKQQKKYQINEHDENQVQAVLKNHKKKKRKKRTKRIVVLLLIIAVIAFIVSPVSKVKSIKVEGTKITEKTDIIKNSQLSTNTFYPLVFFTSSSISKKICKTPMVDHAYIHCDFMGNVKITIKESTKIAWGTIGKKTYVIDRNGRVCQIDKDEDVTGLTKVSDFKKLKLFKEFAKEYVKISSLIRNDVSDIVYSPKKQDSTRIALKLNDGKIFYLRIEDMASQLKNFDYDAYMQTYSDRCIFSFEGENLFMKKCQTQETEEEEDDANTQTTPSTDTTNTN